VLITENRWYSNRFDAWPSTTDPPPPKWRSSRALGTRAYRLKQSRYSKAPTLPHNSWLATYYPASKDPVTERENWDECSPAIKMAEWLSRLDKIMRAEDVME